MEKKIIIKTNVDLDKFYKKLWLYRSFVYRNVIFKLEEDKYNISNFISALNIKSRRKRIEYIYDSACDEIDNFYAGKNICDFKDNQCCVQRKLKNNKFNGCCRMCVHQSKKGCKTKNLTCKLFFCSVVKKRHEVLGIDDVKIIKLLTKSQRYILSNNYFTSKEEVLNDLYIGSIMIVLFRYSYRIVRNVFIRKIKKRDNV